MDCRPAPAVRILGVGSYVPDEVITNADLEKIVDTSDEWIVQRTGIRERRRAAPDQATSDLAVRAAREAMDDAGASPDDIDQVIVGTVTPDYPFPATACRLQHLLGLRPMLAYDLSAACSGFLYACAAARQAILAGTARKVLVVGAETLTRVSDYTDRSTCVLFGDGAGAAVMGAVDPATDGDGRPVGILDIACGCDGAGGDLLIQPGGGSRHPASPASLEAHRHFIHMEGRAVFMAAIPRIVSLTRESMARAGVTLEDIDLFIPHQMNQRIIESAAARLKLPADKIFVNIDRYGNTSSATIPIAIAEAVRSGRLRRGMTAVTVAFGGGLTWAVMLLRW